MKINNQVLKKINDYYVTSKVKYYEHLKLAEKNKNLYTRTTAPIIILSSLTTILASYNGNFVDVRLAVAVAVFSGLTTICQALSAFFEYNTKYEKHITTSNKFINLTRLIENEIYTNYYTYARNDSISEREMDEYVKELFSKIQKELINIQDTETYVPTYISNKKYKNAQCDSKEIDAGLIDFSDGHYENGISGINTEIDHIDHEHIKNILIKHSKKNSPFYSPPKTPVDVSKTPSIKNETSQKETTQKDAQNEKDSSSQKDAQNEKSLQRINSIKEVAIDMPDDEIEFILRKNDEVLRKNEETLKNNDTIIDIPSIDDSKKSEV